MQPDSLAPHQYRRYACTGCGHVINAPVSCGNRFCPICSGPRRRRIRGQLRAIIETNSSDNAFAFRFVTLTIPNQERLDVAARILISSFRRLRQRRFWRTRVRGGCYVLEIAGEPGRWHLHLHIITQGGFLPKRQLSAEWSRCSPGRIVCVRHVPPGAMVGYITKYISKSCLSPEIQKIASDQLQGFRLFQLFGSWFCFARKVKSERCACPKCGGTSWWPLDIPYLNRIYGPPPATPYWSAPSMMTNLI